MFKKMSTVIILIVVLLAALSWLVVNTATKEVVNAVENGSNKVIVIDGTDWKRTTFVDEAGRCWWIYTYPPDCNDRNFVSTGRKIFITPCGEVK